MSGARCSWLLALGKVRFIPLPNPRPTDASAIYVVCVCVQVKLWRLRDPQLQQPSEPELVLRPGQGRLELVLFHPTSSGLLAVGANKSPLIWDTSRQDAPLAGSHT